MKLHYKILGTGKPLVILHGLFGSLDNWQTHAKKLSEYFQVILVDQRNHGHSNWDEIHDYPAMAEDLHELFLELNLKDAYLLGHSMGGKTVMQFISEHEELVEKLIVVDIGMKEYPMHHQQILAGIHAVSAGSMSSRSEAEGLIEPFIPDFGTRQFLMKNLYWKEKQQLAWRMNVGVLENSIQKILASIEAENIHTPTLFIRGELSNYILDEDFEDLENQFIDSHIKTINGAGHWVHAEKPEEFIHTVLEFLLR